MLPEFRIATHPGQILLAEFLEPLRLTQADLARALRIPLNRVNELVRGKRGVTPESALLFSEYFRNSPEFWMNLQTAHDLSRTRHGSVWRRAGGRQHGHPGRRLPGDDPGRPRDVRLTMTQSGLAAQIRQVRRQAVFGLADGAMSITGVVLYAAGQHAEVFPYALAGGVSASLSMAGGEWLSQSDTGLGGAAMMGAATLAGSLIPALPY